MRQLEQKSTIAHQKIIRMFLLGKRHPSKFEKPNPVLKAKSGTAVGNQAKS